MRCSFCNDPRGIIMVDGIPEPCCDEIITQQVREVRGICVNCGESHTRMNEGVDTLSAMCSDECLTEAMDRIEAIALRDDCGGEMPDQEVMDLHDSVDRIDAANLAWYRHAGQYIDNGVDDCLGTPPFWLEYSIERDALESDARIAKLQNDEHKYGCIPF